VCVVARTKKGAGVSFLADREGWHGKPLSAEEARRALAELGDPAGRERVRLPGPRQRSARPSPGPVRAFRPPTYPVGSKVSTREAFGDGLRALGAARPEVVALDGEVSNSTFTSKFEEEAPVRFFELYIAEQQLVSAAVGLQAFGLVPFAATFAAFLSRAYDQVRMAAVSRADLCLVGTHAGISIGEDGPSQMALEDLAMFRAVEGSTVLYPSCASCAAALVEEMGRARGIRYLRATRGKTPVLYGPGERFPLGGSKVLRRSDHDQAALLAAGITLHEALGAQEELAREGIAVRVVDLYSVKPIDAATVEACARECQGRLLVAEDHWAEGGLGDAVAQVFEGRAAPAITRLAVRKLPGSGTPEELLDEAGLSARRIAEVVRRATGASSARRPTELAPPAG
jgi:transketolase